MLPIVNLMIVLSFMDAHGLPLIKVKQIDSDPSIEYVTDWELKGRILFAKQLESKSDNLELGIISLTTEGTKTNDWVWDLLDEFSDYKTPGFDSEDSMMLVSTTATTPTLKELARSEHSIVRRSKIEDDLKEAFDKGLKLECFNDSFSHNRQFSERFLPFPRDSINRKNVKIWRQRDSLNREKGDNYYRTELDRLPNMINQQDILIEPPFQPVTTYLNLNNIQGGPFDMINSLENFNRPRVFDYERYRQYKPLKNLQDNISKYFATAIKPVVTTVYYHRR